MSGLPNAGAAPVFIAALPRELAGLKQVSAGSERSGNKQLAGVVHCGIGRKRAEAAVRGLLRTARPSAIVSVGFAAGVAPDIRGGDLVVPRRIRHDDIPAPKANEIGPDSRLFDWALEALAPTEIKVHTGGLVTVQQPARRPWEKARLAAFHKTDAVDMESYWIGAMVIAAGIPFLVVRAVSDGPQDTLPLYEAFMDDGCRIRPLAAATYYLAHPRHLLDAPRLALNARRGAKRIAKFACAFGQVYGSRWVARSQTRGHAARWRSGS